MVSKSQAGPAGKSELVKAIKAYIAAKSTASDIQVAAAADGEQCGLVTEVRHEMGPKHSWPKE